MRRFVFCLFFALCACPFLRAETEIIAPGLVLETETRTTPRPLRLSWLEVDLTAPDVSLAFSPVDPAFTAPARVVATKPTTLLRGLGWKALLNGDAFYIVGDERKRYPSVGDILALQGYAVVDGKRYGQRSPNNGTFYILSDRKTMGVTYDAPPRDAWGAVGGYRIVLRDGKPGDHIDDTRLHPRSAIGFNNATHKVWFLVVDGRQSGRSEGCSEVELGQWMQARGATDAINLDGGGSAILVLEEKGGARVVNRPVGYYDQPGTIRPIGNAVGVRVGKE